MTLIFNAEHVVNFPGQSLRLRWMNESHFIIIFVRSRVLLLSLIVHLKIAVHFIIAVIQAKNLCGARMKVVHHNENSMSSRELCGH